MDDVEFAQFFWPDFIGVVFGQDPMDDCLAVGPYFDDREKAEYVSDEISKWNPNFIKVSFIEYAQNDYAFVAYQDPQGSFDKLNFSLYRSSMNRQGNYSRARSRLESEPVKIGVFVSSSLPAPNNFVPVGDLENISECKIILESELHDHPLEEMAHRACRGNTNNV